MTIPFIKYQGTGNDFIMIDQSTHRYLEISDRQSIEFLCHRRFGIGADGLILLEQSQKYDFRMVYFNADGRQSTMCGNGGRCIVHFAHSLGIERDIYHFEAIDGLHEACMIEGMENGVRLKMNDVTTIKRLKENEFELNTGSPHFVRFVQEIPGNVDAEGREVRYAPQYAEAGINVNFAVISDHELHTATYERGVEAETLSCGTGVTAVALAARLYNPGTPSPVRVKTKGGDLWVEFESKDGNFSNIWLSGPATPVFTGEIRLGQ